MGCMLSSVVAKGFGEMGSYPFVIPDLPDRDQVQSHAVVEGMKTRCAMNVCHRANAHCKSPFRVNAGDNRKVELRRRLANS